MRNEIGIEPGQDPARIVFGISGFRGEQLEVGGCCFFIYQGLAITAKHVIEDIDERFAVRAPVNGRNDRDYSIQVSANPEGESIAFEVEGIYYCPWSDLALLQVRALDERSFEYPVNTPLMNFLPPKVGTGVFTYGFPRQTAHLDGERVIWSNDPAASDGVIQEVYPEQRDAGMLNFPSFRMNARVAGHMSGGPVINNVGEIVGVISSSLGGDDAADPISYGSILWPLLGTPMFNPATGEPEADHFFFDVFAAGILGGNGWNHATLNRRDPAFRSLIPQHPQT